MRLIVDDLIPPFFYFFPHFVRSHYAPHCRLSFPFFFFFHFVRFPYEPHCRWSFSLLSIFFSMLFVHSPPPGKSVAIMRLIVDGLFPFSYIFFSPCCSCILHLCAKAHYASLSLVLFLFPIFFFKFWGGNIRSHYAANCRWSFFPPFFPLEFYTTSKGDVLTWPVF